MTLEQFASSIDLYGWALLEAVVPEQLLESMRLDLDFAYAICRRVQVKNGLGEATEGTVHHLPALRPSFVRFLEANPAAPYIAKFFGGAPYILQSMGGNFNFPDAENYAGSVHRDVRSFFADRMMINTLVALDDLTTENGATWLMSGGHRVAEAPSEQDFGLAAQQITAPAGSILLWDSRLWHKAGVNRTKSPRRIVTPIFARPFFKPGFDYPRSLGYDAIGISEELRQVLGYNARVPATLDEWYQQPESRFYKRSQG